MRRFVVVLALVVPWTAPAAAQTVMVEGGLAGLGAAVSFGGITVSTGAGGGYLAGDVNIPAVDWFSIYGAANGFADFGAMGQLGAGFRLGPEHWIARPALRGGAAFGSGGGMATGGLGVYIGRRAGGLFTADWAASGGVTYAIVHIGAYYSFGGE